MRILLATDLSPAGVQGVEGILACGRAGIDHVTLLHVIDLDPYTAGGSVPEIAEWATEGLSALAERLGGQGFPAEVRVEWGSAVETIESVAREQDADLVVLTSLGKGALKGRVLGSTAERLVTRAALPVLLERVEQGGEQWCRLGSGSPFARVLVACAFDETAETMLGYVRDLPGVTALHLVHVTEDGLQPEGVEGWMREVAATARVTVDPETTVAHGDVGDRITEIARDWNASIIVIGPRRRGALRRLVLGSTARRVAETADRAVMFVPTDA
jgi:nucleotide-binding universal stress UspA family protein